MFIKKIIFSSFFRKCLIVRVSRSLKQALHVHNSTVNHLKHCRRNGLWGRVLPPASGRPCIRHWGPQRICRPFPHSPGIIETLVGCSRMNRESLVWLVQWTQNISELQLRHWKRGRKDGKGRVGARRQRVCLGTYSVTENMFIPFKFRHKWLHFQTLTFTLHCILWTKGTIKH
jgi:hypothetical protein